VILAMRSGVAPDEWLADTRALVTAVELYSEADRQAEAERRRRR
jgi:hypothetical protein